MKLPFRTFCVGIFFSCLSTCLAAGLEVTFAYSDIESFPYQMGNGAQVANPPGLAVDIISQAAEDIGVTIKLVRYPNKRVFSYIESGKVDGGFIYSFKKERAAKAQYPMLGDMPDPDKRIATISYYLYKHKSTELQWNGKQITGLQGRIGANAGYSIVADLQQMGVTVHEYYGSYQHSKIFKLLEMNRIGAVAAQDVTSDPYLKSAGFRHIEKLPLPLKTKDYYLLFSHQFIAEHPDIANQLWQRISEIREKKNSEAISKYN